MRINSLKRIVCLVLAVIMILPMFTNVTFAADDMSPLQKVLIRGLSLDDTKRNELVDGMTELSKDPTKKGALINEIQLKYLPSLSVVDISSALDAFLDISSNEVRNILLYTIRQPLPTIGDSSGFSNIKAKFNTDITNDSANDNGLKFVVSIMKQVSNVTPEIIVGDSSVNKNLIYINRLEKYTNARTLADSLFATIQTLPFNDKSFDGFTTYYESFINTCSYNEIKQFKLFLGKNSIYYGEADVSISPFQKIVLEALNLPDGVGYGTRIAFSLYLSDLVNGKYTVDEAATKIKTDYIPSMSEADIKTALVKLNSLTPVAQSQSIAIIKSPIEVASYTAIPNIKEKINKDLTANAKDNRGILLMYNVLDRVYLAAVAKGFEGALVYDNVDDTSKISFNRLNEFSNAKEYLDNVFSTIDSLPFEPGTFEGFVNSYEKFINAQTSSEIKAFKEFMNGIDGRSGMYRPTSLTPTPTPVPALSALQRIIIEALSLPDGVGDGTRVGFSQYLNDYLSGNVTLSASVAEIKTTYITSMSEADINTALTKLKSLSTIAQTHLISIIKAPMKIADNNDFPSIKEKINKDLTGNSIDDRGLLLMYNVLCRARYAMIAKGFNGALVTDDNDNLKKIYFNRLNEYSNTKVYIDEVLSTIDSLPFSPRTFDGFINNYEVFINAQATNEIEAFKEFLNGVDGSAGLYIPRIAPTITATPTSVVEIPTSTVTPTPIIEHPTNTVTPTPTIVSVLSALQKIMLEALSLPDGIKEGTRVGFGNCLSDYLSGSLTLDAAVTKIKTVYIKNMSETDIITALTRLKSMSNTAQVQLISIIKFPMKIAESDDFPNIKEKLDSDLTGNSMDDRGLLLIYNVLYRANYALTVKGFTGPLATDDKFEPSRIYFNRLSEYENSKVYIDEILSTIETLPFSPKTFDGLIENYEGFINSQTAAEIKAFKEFLNGPDGIAGLYISTFVPTVTPTPTPTVEVTSTPISTTTPTPTVEVTSTPISTTTPTPTVEVTSTPISTTTPTPTVEVTSTPTSTTSPTPTVEVISTPTSTTSPTPTVEITSTPTSTTTPTPTGEITSTPTSTTTPTPTGEVTSTPTSTTTPISTPTPTKKKGHKHGPGVYIPNDDTPLGANDVKFNIIEVPHSELLEMQKPKVIDSDVVYDVSIKDGSELKGLTKLSLPYVLKPGEDPRKATVYIFDAEGNIKNMMGKYDEATKTVGIMTGKLGRFVIRYNNIIFKDIESFGWAKDFIEVLSAKGVIYGIGDDLYSPDRNLTRAEFAALIVRAFNLNDETATNSFIDVDVNEWYYKEVSAAVKSGIIVGRPDNTFAPYENISRQDMAVVISKVLTTYLGKKAESSEDVLKQFADKNDISDYARLYVATVTKHGIMVGEPAAKFNPLDNTNRAQAAVATYKLFNAK